MWTRDDIARTGYPHRRNKMPDIPRLRDSRGTKVLPRLAELAAVFILPILSTSAAFGTVYRDDWSGIKSRGVAKNLHFPHLHRTQIYKSHIYTKPRFTQTQIYTAHIYVYMFSQTIYPKLRIFTRTSSSSSW